MPASIFGSTVNPEPGTIAMWSDPISNIPSGWALCDGNNGTPNMLDRFVADTGSPGTTGGQNSYTVSHSQMPRHTHAASANSAGLHDHVYATDDDRRSYPPYGDGPGTDSTGEHFTSTDGSHSHSVSVGSTGGGGSVDNRPLYYELAFIMKL